MIYGELAEPRGPHTHVWQCTGETCTYSTWAPKPKNANVRRDLKDAKRVLEESGRPRVCEMCLRSEQELPPLQVLEVHHMIEVQDGGTNDLDNLRWLCTDDHAYVHHRRRYAVRVERNNGNHA